MAGFGSVESEGGGRGREVRQDDGVVGSVVWVRLFGCESVCMRVRDRLKV